MGREQVNDQETGTVNTISATAAAKGQQALQTQAPVAAPLALRGQPIQQRGGDYGVAEAEVAGHENCAALISGIDDLEEQIASKRACTPIPATVPTPRRVAAGEAGSIATATSADAPRWWSCAHAQRSHRLTWSALTPHARARSDTEPIDMRAGTETALARVVKVFGATAHRIVPTCSPTDGPTE